MVLCDTMKNKTKKADINWEVIAWIIAALLLIFLTILAIILKKQGSSIVEKIKDFLRFGR